MAVDTTEQETEAAPEENPQASEIPEKDPSEPTTVGNEPEGIEAAYSVTGVYRKQLVVAVSEITNIEPEYKAADSGYESEENYAGLQEMGVEAYIKPTNYEKSKTKKYKSDCFRAENMPYSEEIWTALHVLPEISCL